MKLIHKRSKVSKVNFLRQKHQKSSILGKKNTSPKVKMPKEICQCLTATEALN